MTENIINVPLYRRSVVLLEGEETELLDWFDEHGDSKLRAMLEEIDWENTEAVTMDDGSDVYICCIKPMKLPKLCHELSHATLRIMKMIGIDPLMSEEAYAYLFEYLVREAMESDIFERIVCLYSTEGRLLKRGYCSTMDSCQPL